MTLEMVLLGVLVIVLVDLGLDAVFDARLRKLENIHKWGNWHDQ